MNRIRGIHAALFAIAMTTPTMSSAQATMDHAAPTKNIVQVAVAAGQFKTLVTAVTAAGLAETLQSAGPFTVFAPTDAAFAKLPAGTIDVLLKDKAKLASILTYHVLSGKVASGDIVKAGKLSPITVNGQKVAVELRHGKVYVGGAQVVTADIQASNGVIHVIDAVLLPKTN